MILGSHNLHVVESADRRILVVVQLMDAVTRLPVVMPATIRARAAELVRDDANIAVPLSAHSVTVVRNPSGYHILTRAPFFDDYTGSFIDPEAPDETLDGPLRISLALEAPGPSYLPQSFTIDLPRPADPDEANSVFEPVQVHLLRAPSAPLQHGWAALRVRVVEAGTDPPEPLPGVLLRVFRSPRSAEDAPVGWGMTDWRGRVRGEALVIVDGVQRFRPGSGAGGPGSGGPGSGGPGSGDGPGAGGPGSGGPGSDGPVIETTLSVVIEAARLVGFTGAPDEIPDVGEILAAIPEDLDAEPGTTIRLVREAHALDVRAGRETSVELSMP